LECSKQQHKLCRPGGRREEKKERKERGEKRRGLLVQGVGLLKANGLATQRKEKGHAGWATSAAQIEEKANGLHWKINLLVYIYIYIFCFPILLLGFLR
jgi:antibiotic biosynthesis monooxygenase (ABM) superfamily enzyme